MVNKDLDKVIDLRLLITVITAYKIKVLRKDIVKEKRATGLEASCLMLMTPHKKKKKEQEVLVGFSGNRKLEAITLKGSRISTMVMTKMTLRMMVK